MKKPLTKTELKKLQKKHGSDHKVAKAAGLKRIEIFQLRKDYNLPSIYNGIATRNEKMKKMCDKGKSVEFIAGKFELSIGYVRSLISDFKREERLAKLNT